MVFVMNGTFWHINDHVLHFENLCVNFRHPLNKYLHIIKKENTFAVPIIVRTCSSCKQLKMLSVQILLTIPG